jgi:hypothetical protein
MNKKQILFILATFLFSIIYSQNTSIENKKFDNFIKVQKENNLKQDAEIKSIKEFEKSYEIKESLFSNQLSILTAIFSTIVAISIFLIGFLIPKLNNEKYKNEIIKLLSEVKLVRDEIKESRNETIRVETENNYFNSRLMFYSCYDSKFPDGTFLWALRHCEFRFIKNKDVNDDEVPVFLEEAKNAVKILHKSHKYRDYIEEVNRLTDLLLEKYSTTENNELLTYIKEEYNKQCWVGKQKED